jgi:hypothetical protein
LKFKNLSTKIDELISNGKFWSFSNNQQEKLVTKLRSLFEKLSSLNPKYALKVAGAAMCFTLITGAANAQTFQEWTAGTSPISFNSLRVSTDYTATSFEIFDGAFADIDGDGDKDAILLSDSAPIFFENVSGTFTENLAENPFSFECGSHIYISPSFALGIDIADFDGDGDLDAILVQNSGSSSTIIEHYEMVEGKFEYVSGSPINNGGNSGSSLSFGPGIQAKFADVDGDGDLDIVGAWYCGIGSFLQQSDHNFVLSHSLPLSIEAGISAVNSRFNLADMDGDGDKDLFVFRPTAGSPGLADATGNIRYFENTPGSGAFASNSNIPLPVADMSSYLVPLLADLDGDGDIDVLIPGNGTEQAAFQNLTGNPSVPVSPIVALLAFAASGFGVLKRNRKKKVE